jgi:DNA polymerase-3 subunit delta
MARKPAKPDPASESAATASGTARSGPTPSGKLDSTCWVGILNGTDAYLRTSLTAQLRAALTKEHGTVDLVQYDGSGAGVRPSDVLDECRSFGLIAGYKLVIVDNAEDLIKEDNRPLFERYVASLIESNEAPGATLLLRADSWRPGKLDELIKKVGAIVKCKAPEPPEAIRWVGKRARSQHKATIDADAADLLVMRVGPDLSRLDSELGKLAAVAAGQGEVGGEARITRALVAEFVGMSREEKVWNIQTTLLASSAPDALSHLKYLLEVSRESNVVVSYALVDLARKLHSLSRAAKAGKRTDQIEQALKLWGGARDLLIDAAKRTPPSAALEIFRVAMESDVRQKSGLGDPPVVLERAFLQASLLLHGK